MNATPHKPRIMFYTLIISPYHKLIFKGFKKEMKKIFPEYELIIKNGDRPDYLTTRDGIGVVSKEHADLIVTIGDYFSQVLAEEMSGRRYPLPTVFCALSKGGSEILDAKRSSGANYLTGVYPEPQPLYTPLQGVLRLYPNAETILIPYLKGSLCGRIEFEIEQVIEYCSIRKISVEPVALEKGDNLITKLSQKIKDNDLTMTLTGSLDKEVQIIEKMCQEAEKPFVGNGQEIQKSSMVFSLEKDAIFMGTKVAETCKKILLDQVKPIDIEPIVIKHAGLIQHEGQGVFLANNLAIFSENHPLHDDRPRHRVTVSLDFETAYGISAYARLGNTLNARTDIRYLVNKHRGWGYDEKMRERQCRHLLTNQSSMIVLLGDQYAAQVWEFAKRSGITMPPTIVVSLDDQRADRLWHDEVRDSGTPLVHVALPAPDPLKQLHMLQETMKEFQQLTSFTFGDKKHNILPHLQSRYAQVERACQSAGIDFSLVPVANLGELLTARESHLKMNSNQACFFYHDAIPGFGASGVLDTCHERLVIACAGGPLFGQISPMSYGVDMVELQKILIKIITDYIEHHKLPENLDIIMSHDSVYATSANIKLCEELGLTMTKLAEQKLLLPDNDIVSAKGLSATTREPKQDEEVMRQRQDDMQRRLDIVLSKIRIPFE